MNKYKVHGKDFTARTAKGIKIRNRDYRACQYMYVALQSMQRAVVFFNSSIPGDVEKSFGSMQKAWLHLFQADILISGNGKLHMCDGLNGSECPNKFNCKDKTHSESEYLYGIEKALNEIEKGKSTVYEAANGYIYSQGTGLFAEMNHKNGFFNNLIFIKQLRNIEQHDYLDSDPKFSLFLMVETKPYVIANMKNFLDTYHHMMSRRKACSKNIIYKPHCSCRFLVKTSELSRTTWFKWSLDDFLNILQKDDKSYGKQVLLSIHKTENLVKEEQCELDKCVKELNTYQASLEKTKKNPNAKVEELERKINFAKEKVKLKEMDLMAMRSRLENIKNSLLRYRNTEDESQQKIYRKEAGKIIEKAYAQFQQDDDFRFKVNAEFEVVIHTIDEKEALEKAEHQALKTLMKSQISPFKFNDLKSVKEHLDKDYKFPYVISVNKLKSIAHDLFMENSNEEYYGTYFGSARYTVKFLRHVLLLADEGLFEDKLPKKKK